LACYDKIAHVVVMQHHNRDLLDQFLDEMGIVAPQPSNLQLVAVEHQPVVEVLST
jgi:hypothetical protein